MVSKSQRTINSKAAKNMVTWNHHRSSQQLLKKGQRVLKLQIYYLRWRVHQQNLQWMWVSSPQSWRRKVVQMSTLQQKSDRNFNAGRNVLLKSITIVYELDVESLLLGSLGILQGFDYEYSSLNIVRNHRYPFFFFLLSPHFFRPLTKIANVS